MDLNLLRTFCTVAETQNISRAAEQRHLTQPAVSLQIKQLETLVGAALFLRHPLRLTETGEHLLANAQDILSRWQQTLDFVQQQQELTRGSLTIACSDTLLRYRLLQPLQQFRARYPGVDVALLNRTSEEARLAVLKGEADLALGLHQHEHPKLIHRNVLTYQEVALVSPQHSLAGQAALNARQLTGQPLLLLEEKTQSHKLLRQWLATKQLQVVHSMALGSVDAQIEMARLGLGVAIVPAFTVPDDLVAIAVRGLPERQIACYYQHLKPAAQAWLRLPEDPQP